MSTQTLARVSTRGQIGHFMLHYFEMCVPMCVGFAVLDLVYYWAAGLAGYTNPFRQLPMLFVRRAVTRMQSAF